MAEILIVDPVDLLDMFGKDFIEEGSWQGATSVSEELDIEIGSEDFVSLYEEMKEALTWATTFAAQICHTSLQVVNILLQSSQLWLQLDEDITARDAILLATETIATATLISIATIKAGPGHGMLTNEQVSLLDKHHRLITFIVDTEQETE